MEILFDPAISLLSNQRMPQPTIEIFGPPNYCCFSHYSKALESTFQLSINKLMKKILYIQYLCIYLYSIYIQYISDALHILYTLYVVCIIQIPYTLHIHIFLKKNKVKSLQENEQTKNVLRKITQSQKEIDHMLSSYAESIQ